MRTRVVDELLAVFWSAELVLTVAVLLTHPPDFSTLAVIVIVATSPFVSDPSGQVSVRLPALNEQLPLELADDTYAMPLS
jgi:hypothetical protein